MLVIKYLMLHNAFMHEDDLLTHDVRLKKAAGIFRRQAAILICMLTIFWGLELIDWLPATNLDQYGIQPRTQKGLWHIFTAPFLHVGFGHVASNSIPFLVMGWFVMLRGLNKFAMTTLITTIIGGVGIWLTGGANTVHLGASILVFGYLGFLLLNSVFERSLSAIGLTLATVLLYGSLIWSVLPMQPHISWQGHLFGFIGGGIAAHFLSKQ